MKIHLGYFYRQIARVLKPGRVLVVHVMQIPDMKRTGGKGLINFRDLNIRLGKRAGLIYEYDWLLRKDPQAQAIRTHSHELQFAGMERDRANCRGALADYLIKFNAKGENAVPVDSEGDVSRNDWIDWAECTWDGLENKKYGELKKSNLNTKVAKSDEDVRHICPFNLATVDRLVRLYTNPGEIVLDPFSGIGSTGYVSLKLRRRYYGVELKKEYHAASLRNLEMAIRERYQSTASLFDAIPEGATA